MKSSPLEIQLNVERLKRYLNEHPEQATSAACEFFEDFSLLAEAHKELERDFLAMQTELDELQQLNPQTRKSPQLLSFINN